MSWLGEIGYVRVSNAIYSYKIHGRASGDKAFTEFLSRREQAEKVVAKKPGGHFSDDPNLNRLLVLASRLPIQVLYLSS